MKIILAIIGLIIIAFVISGAMAKKRRKLEVAQTDYAIKNSLQKDFVISRMVKDAGGKPFLLIDDVHKKFGYKKTGCPSIDVYGYEDVASAEIYENGRSFIEADVTNVIGRSMNQICTSLQVHVTLKSLQNPLLIIDIYNGQLSKSKFNGSSNDMYEEFYNMAKEVLGIFQFMNSSLKVK